MSLKSTNWGNYSHYLGPDRTPGSPPAVHVRDVRLTLITALGFSFEGARCLDVGCNDGTVGTQLAIDFGARHVVGVDIDPDLVAKARRLRTLRASRLRPPGSAVDDEPAVVDYYPMSAVLNDLSTRGAPPSSSSWPRVEFVAADWVASTHPAFAGPYDFILALNVIKWIHLEHLDAGVATFFQKCHAALATGGYLVIQLQTWDSYQKAVRYNAAPHFAANLAKLKYRPETSFPDLLQHQGFNLCATSAQLRRQINIYRKA